MIINKAHICVCICTYKRPELLKGLLKKLQHQKTGDVFTYSIIVVDNDDQLSADNVVKEIKKESIVTIEYYAETERNIALARNTAVKNAKGNFVAFIDDDEFPDDDWLFNLIKTGYDYNAECILGPVKPFFAEIPPTWILKGKLCDRPTYKTGTVLHWAETRTGNVLFNKNIFNEKDNIFDRDFGRTGGSDVVFFKKLAEKGYVFVWCNEAPVYEIVTPNRLKLSYFLKRGLLQGKNSFRYFNEDRPYYQKSVLIIKTIIAFFLYTLALPFLFLIGKHIFLKYLIKNFHHLGRLFYICGVDVVKNRNF